MLLDRLATSAGDASIAALRPPEARSDMANVALNGRGGGRTIPLCRHCGAPVAGSTLAAAGFCCSGCAYVFRLVHEHGLEAYYTIKDELTAPADSAVFQPRDFAWAETVQREAEAKAKGGVATASFDVQGISCAGCVWLIERLFMERSAARDIVVNAQVGSMRITWLAGNLSVPEWAKALQAFGYIMGPAGEEPGNLESSGLARRIGLCAAFSLNVMLFTLPVYFGMSPTFAYAGLFKILSLAFATLSVLVGGTYFIDRAIRALSSRVMHIDLPIAIGIVGAYAASLYGWVAGIDRFVYADFVATFTLLMLVGRWAQVGAVERNRQRLLRRQPVPARIRLSQGGDVSRDDLKAGQSILISPGQSVPVESQLEDPIASFSLASISGEPEPRLFSSGQRIPAGAVNVDRSQVRLRAAQAWESSLLAELLAATERSGERHIILERVVRGYVIGIIGAALVGGCFWWIRSHDLVRAGSVAIAVLVVSCPCAIGLALPLADEMATSELRRRGVFIREPDIWSRLGRIRTIIFDKTGTLTLETPVLLNPAALAELPAEAKRALLTLVQDNLHPVAQCLNEHLMAEASIEPLEGTVEEIVGKGVSLGGWSLGKAGWRDSGSEGTASVLAREGQEIARFDFSDSARPGARNDIATLRREGFRICILSGDRAEKVSAMAAELGICAEEALGDLSPEQKAEWIQRNASENALMLGDGANDSLAFDRARCRGTPVIHRGILEGKADFYYLRRGIGGILELFAVEKTRRQVQWLIMGFSVTYNVVAAGFALAGMVSPLVAAVIMPASSLVSLGLVSFGMSRARPANVR